MREIDLLPKWYKSGRQRQTVYRVQYAVLGVIFLIMMVWNFVSACAISKAEAQLDRDKVGQSQLQAVSDKFTEIENKVSECKHKASLINDIDSRIDVSDVLAELSFLIDKNIVLSNVHFKAENFPDSFNVAKSVRAVSGINSTHRTGWTKFSGKVRFKVIIKGLASDSSDVAELICRLEKSAYFCQVYPMFSQNSRMEAAAGSSRNKVSEFEISCYLANYILQDDFQNRASER